MDVKKFAAVVAAMTMAGVISLSQAPVNTPDGLLTVSAATYLKLESSGDDVKQLQQNLITLNYMQSGSDTGTFDATTDGAVKNLQTEYNLKVDGIVGPATLGLIQGLVNGTAQIVKVDEVKVNVRTKAGTDGDIITTVAKDQKLKYDAVETVGDVKWYKVSVGETEGYICGTYVSVVTLTPTNGTATTTTNAAVVTTNANATGGTLKVTGTILNVRSSTSTSSKKLTTVEKGQTYSYSNVKTVDGINWYYIKVNSTTSGWVMGTFVSVGEATETSGSLKVTGNILNVRSDASISAQKITELKNGDTYTYTDVKNVAGINWYYIKVNASTNGWVMGSYVSLVQPGTASAPESGSLKVTGTILNVRASASTSAKKLTTLKQGKTCTYSNTKTVDGIKWYYIRVNSSISGWVMGTYVYATPNTTATATEITPSAADGTATGGTLKIQGTLVNVRSGAGTENDKITQVKQGQNYTYTEVKDGWYYIKLSSSKSGWVMGDYVEATPYAAVSTTVTTTTAGTATTTTAGAESGTLTVTGTVVNVRSGAGTENAKITEVKQGESYTYTDKKDGWYYIQISESQSGWIMGDFVSATANPTTTSTESATVTSAADESGTLVITGTTVNVRAGIGTDSAKITEVKQGESYTYTSARNGWYYIQLNATQGGWVLGDFVQATPNSTTAPVTTTTAPPPESGSLKVTGTVVNVRSGAGTDNAKITEVKQGSVYTYTNKQDNWYYIQISETQSGWITGEFVQATPNTTTTATTTAPSASNDGSTVSVTGSTGSTGSTDANASTQTTGSATTTTTTTAVNNTGSLTITGAAVVNVRAGAGTGFKKVAEVKKGNSYTYTNVENDWYYIQYSASQSGWISGSYAVVTPNTGTTRATAAYTAVGSLTVTGTKINIRSMPDSESTKIAEAKKGETFQYLYQIDEWYCVQLSSSQTGWLLASYVEAKPYPTTITTTLDPTDPTNANQSSLLAAYGEKSGTFELTVKSVNVRTGPDKSYEKITEIPDGEKYEYIDIKDNWYCIPIGETKGWVSGDYVAATPNPTAAPTTTTTVTTTTTTEASTTTTESSTATSADDSTTVAGESTTVSTEPTTVDTTTAETTEATEEPTTTTSAATVGRQVTVGTVKVSGNLNVRSGAGTNYAKLGTLKNGATVVIATKGSKWHKIEYGTSYGYVNADYVTDIKTTYENMILKYNGSYNYVNKGGTLDLGLSVSGTSISYSSSDNVRCPISNKGVITGKTEGLYTITAKSGAAIATTCVVVLKEPNTDVQEMRISAQGTQFIADWEGGGTILPTIGETVFYPYQDVSGYWTIGYGHAKTTTASKSWSEERAIAEFNKDIEAMIGADYMLTDEKPYLTADGATALLNADLNDGAYVKAVSDWAVRNGVKLTQTQFDALVSFCYNLGPSLWQNDNTKFYLKSAIISHRSGSKANADQVIEGFCRYMKSAGKNYKGLWYRRRNEAELFLEGDYALDRENKFTLPSGITWS